MMARAAHRKFKPSALGSKFLILPAHVVLPFSGGRRLLCRDLLAVAAQYDTRTEPYKVQ